MKVIIVGGVAGGASCAARLRRLDEQAEILMVERGPYVSYANCGLPYHVGSVIEHESDLLVASPAGVPAAFQRRLPHRLRGRSASRRRTRPSQLRDVATGEVTTESYDKLVLSPGAPSVRPPLPGIDLPGHLRGAHRARRQGDPRVDRTRDELPRRDGEVLGVPDRAAADARGGGRRRVHRPGDGREPGASRVRRHRDRDGRPGARPARSGVRAARRATSSGSTASMSSSVTASRGSRRPRTSRSWCRRSPGNTYPADLVILALGVRPDTTLAKMAGIEIGELGGIRVDDHMRTSNPDIFAVGDAVEVRDFVTGQWSLVALAGPREPAGPHRRRRDRRARLPVPRHPGHVDRRTVRRRRRLDRRQREDARPRR